MNAEDLAKKSIDIARLTQNVSNQMQFLVAMAHVAAWLYVQDESIVENAVHTAIRAMDKIHEEF